MKSIGCFFEYLPPDPVGVSLRGWHILKFLDRSFDEVLVYTRTKKADLPFKNVRSIALGFSPPGSRWSRLASEIFLGLSIFANLFFRKGFDGFLISSPSFVASFFVVLALRLRGKAYILDVRDAYPEAFVTSGIIGKNSIFNKVFTSMSRFMYKGSSVVLVATRGLGMQVKESCPEIEPVLLYNGFPGFLSSISSVKHKKFTVCFHGVLGFFQNIELLSKVILLGKPLDIDFVVVGDGRKRCLLPRESANLTYIPSMINASLMNELSKCHIGISLRSDEVISRNSFPIKVWEYLGLGLPSIISPPSEASNLMSDLGCSLSFRGDDPEELIELIVKIKDDKDLYSRMTQSCLSSRNKYNRERLVSSVLPAVIEKFNK